MGLFGKLLSSALKIVFVVSLFMWASFKISGPGRQFTLEYNKKKVVVRKDQHHIPTISGDDKPSAFYGYGYVQAQDRLFQLHTRRMGAMGRLAEFSGKADMLPIDKFFRELGFNRFGKRMAERLKQDYPQSADCYDAYSQGINDYVATFGLPLEFYLTWAKWEDWKPEHSFAMLMLFDWVQTQDPGNQFIRSFLLSQGNMTKEEIDEMFPYSDKNMIVGATTVTDQDLKDSGHYEQKVYETPVFEPKGVSVEALDKKLPEYFYDLLFSGEGGSNCVVVSGKHTKSGQPMLGADPHLEAVMPSQIYLSHLQYKDNNGHLRRISLSAVIGSFNMLLHTNYISYSVTTTHIDNADLYQQTTNQTHYLVDGQWLPLQVVVEPIKIGSQVIHHTIRFTHRGPIVSSIFYQGKRFTPSNPISLCWVGHNSNGYLPHSIISIMDVSSFQEMQAHGLKHTNVGPPVNLIYITADDRIGATSMGALPIRPNKLSGGYVKNGSSTKDDWVGLVPASLKLVHNDSPKGYYINANNKPASNHKLGGLYVGGFQYTARANRLTNMIEGYIKNGTPITAQILLAMQTDLLDQYCVELLPKVSLLVPELGAKLKGFDCVFKSESQQATWYEVFMNQYQHLLRPHPEVPVEGTVTFGMYITRKLLKIQAGTDPKKMILLRTAFQRTESYIKQKFGDKAPEWGAIHTDYMPFKVFSNTPLSRFYDRNHPGRGNLNTPNYARMMGLANDDYRTNIRANVRFVRSFAPSESGNWTIDAGQQQSILHASYDDLWLNFQKNILLPVNPLWADTTDSDLQL